MASQIYVITVRGQMSARWTSWFEGMTVTNLPNGNAMIVGSVPDQAALHGLLTKVRDLGLALLSVLPGPENGGGGS